jgi:hypothetical protein
MIPERTIELARRKERLLARCEEQRATVAKTYRRWQEPARIIDRGWAAARFARAHPATLAVAVMVAMVLGRGNILRWAGRGLVAWRAWRSLSRWLGRISA